MNGNEGTVWQLEQAYWNGYQSGREDAKKGVKAGNSELSPYRQVNRLYSCEYQPVRDFAYSQLSHAVILHVDEAWSAFKWYMRHDPRHVWTATRFHLRHGED